MTNKYTPPSGSYISFMSNKVKEFGGINLAQGIPGFQPPKELIECLNKLSYDDVHQYAPGTGDLDLLEVLISKYKNFSKENFMIVNGGTEALSLIFTYIHTKFPENFSVMSFSPVYESYKNLPRIFNRPFYSFPINEKKIDFEDLEKKIIEKRVKIFFVASPGNPYGRALSKNEFDQLLALCEKHKFFVIIDAVYKELFFGEKPYIPLEKINEYTFYTNSFSKLFSITGWRIGYFISHPKHMERLKSIHDYIGLCSPSFLQKALALYMKKYDYGEKYVSKLREELYNRFSYMQRTLNDLGFQIPKTDGGYFIWAKLPKGYEDGFKFTIDLYEKTKVAVIPGKHFSEDASSFVRINIARKEEEVLLAIKHINGFLKQSHNTK